MIAIIDYGMGNLGSIKNMLDKIGVSSIITNNKDEIINSDKLILPGVGAFDQGMKRLIELDLVDTIKSQVLVERKPILGICLGMQLLGTSSEEGKQKGLNLVSFVNKKFVSTDNNKIKVPNMGWKNVEIEHDNSPLLVDINNTYRFYFVHSYYASCDDTSNIILTFQYGFPVTAAVQKDNIYGTQFHPEKSHRYGMKILENFSLRC